MQDSRTTYHTVGTRLTLNMYGVSFKCFSHRQGCQSDPSVFLRNKTAYVLLGWGKRSTPSTGRPGSSPWRWPTWKAVTQEGNMVEADSWRKREGGIWQIIPCLNPCSSKRKCLLSIFLSHYILKTKTQLGTCQNNLMLVFSI